MDGGGCGQQDTAVDWYDTGTVAADDTDSIEEAPDTGTSSRGGCGRDDDSNDSGDSDDSDDSAETGSDDTGGDDAGGGCGGGADSGLASSLQRRGGLAALMVFFCFGRRNARRCPQSSIPRCAYHAINTRRVEELR